MKLTSELLSLELRAEFEDVYASLLDVAETLTFPLNNLVLEAIRNAEPFARAGIVLASASRNQDSEALRADRIHLASALEMLYVALNVHKSLLSNVAAPNHAANGNSIEPPTTEQSDKIIMGSTILAGDYCFSRSAAMATKTGKAEVVDIFSEVLKSVSEEHLRSIFDDSTLSHKENGLLLSAGVQAATKLIDAPNEMLLSLTTMSQELTEQLASATPQSDTLLSDSLLNELESHRINLSDVQFTRWQEIIVWLAAS